MDLRDHRVIAWMWSLILTMLDGGRSMIVETVETNKHIESP